MECESNVNLADMNSYGFCICGADVDVHFAVWLIMFHARAKHNKRRRFCTSAYRPVGTVAQGAIKAETSETHSQMSKRSGRGQPSRRERWFEGQSGGRMGQSSGWGSRPDGAVVADPTPAQAGQAVGADDEKTAVALHPTGEGVVALGVVGTGVLHVLLDDGGAVGAGGAEGAGTRSGLGHASRTGGNNGQAVFRQPSVTGLSSDRQSWWMARLQSQHQMPLMTVVSASRSTTRTARAEPQPQHISRNWREVGSSRNLGVWRAIRFTAYSTMSVASICRDHHRNGLARCMTRVVGFGSVG